MIVDFAVYDSTGTIKRTGTVPAGQESLQADAASGEYVVVTKASIESDRVSNPTGPSPSVVVKTPTTATSTSSSPIAANGTAEFVVSNVPIGSRAFISVPAGKGISDTYDAVVNDGVVVVTSTIPGNYILELFSNNYLTYKVSFDAV